MHPLEETPAANIRRRTSCRCARAGLLCRTPRIGPARARHAEVNGTKLAYVEQGRGTTVVFVHGSIRDWRTSESQRPAFAARYRYVAYRSATSAPTRGPTTAAILADDARCRPGGIIRS